MKKQSLNLIAVFKIIERFARRNPDWTIREMATELRRRDLLDLEGMALERTRQFIRSYNDSKKRRGEEQKLIFTFVVTDEDGVRQERRTSVENMTAQQAGIVMDELLAQISHDVSAARRTHDLFRRRFGDGYKYFGQPFLNGFTPWDDPDAE